MRLNLEIKSRLVELTSYSLNCMVALSLMTLQPVNTIDPMSAQEPVVKDGKAFSVIHSSKRNPYSDLTNSVAIQLLIINGSLLIWRGFGKTALIELGQDIQGVFTRQVEAVAEVAQSVKISLPSAVPFKDNANEFDPPADWMEAFLKAPHGVIVGESGGGKTVATTNVLVRYLELNPDSQLIILDSDGGKEGNDWLGLMRGDKDGNQIVFTDHLDIVNQVDRLFHLMQDRRAMDEQACRGTGKRVNHSPILCVYDEWVATSREIEKIVFKGDKKSFDEHITQLEILLLKGRGYKIKFIGASQNLNATKLGIADATVSALNKLWMFPGGKSIDETRLKTKFPLDGSDDDSVVLDRLKGLVSSNKRAFLLNIDGKKQAYATPHLTLPQSLRDDNEIWLEQVLEKYESEWVPEIIRHVNGDRASPLKDFCKSIKLEQRIDDPRYSEQLKPWYEKQVNQIKQSINN